LWQELLNTGNTQEIALLLETLNSSRAFASFEIDWLSLVLHDDEKIQYETRKVIKNFVGNQPNKANQLATALQQVVEDKERDDDRIAAIRGLAALMGTARDAMPVLENHMMDSNQPLPVRVAASNALLRITGSRDLQRNFFEAIRSEHKDRQDTPEFRKELEQLDQAIQAEARAIP
jgi:hypothetical protein